MKNQSYILPRETRKTRGDSLDRRFRISLGAAGVWNNFRITSSDCQAAVKHFARPKSSTDVANIVSVCAVTQLHVRDGRNSIFHLRKLALFAKFACPKNFKRRAQLPTLPVAAPSDEDIFIGTWGSEHFILILSIVNPSPSPASLKYRRDQSPTIVHQRNWVRSHRPAMLVAVAFMRNDKYSVNWC